jgi:tRNA (guanine37-N1)-methyltransferase
MKDRLDIDVITIFPAMLDGFLRESMMKRAEQAGRVTFHVHDLRDFTEDNHRTTDDRPYGGGPGMIMKPEPIFRAVEAVRRETSRIILMSPQGERFSQPKARALSEAEHLIFISGHYEGVDERIRKALVTDELSIGDYVLTNGTLPAAVVIDAVVRLLPGVLGAGEEATETESFASEGLEYAQYTRPSEFRGMKVPDILLSGDHGEIARWRAEQARLRTAERRPDLVKEGEHGEKK